MPGPLAGIGIGLGSALLSGLLGGKSGSEKQALAAQSQAAQSEAALLDLIRKLGLDASGLLSGLQEGGRPPAFRIDLENPTDIEDFFGQLGHNAPFNKTLELISSLKGAGGTGNIQSSALQAFQSGRDRNALVGDTIQNIILALLTKGGGGGGQSSFQLPGNIL